MHIGRLVVVFGQPLVHKLHELASSVNRRIVWPAGNDCVTSTGICPQNKIKRHFDARTDVDRDAVQRVGMLSLRNYTMRSKRFCHIVKRRGNHSSFDRVEILA